MATEQQSTALDDEATLAYEPSHDTPLKHRARRYTAEMPITGVRNKPEGESVITLDPKDLEALEENDAARADLPSVPPPPLALTQQLSHQEPAQRVDDMLIAFSLLRPGEDQHALGTILERMGDEPALALVASRACSMSVAHRADLIGQVIAMTVRELPKLRAAEELARNERLTAEYAVKSTFDSLRSMVGGQA